MTGTAIGKPSWRPCSTDCHSLITWAATRVTS